MKFSKEKEIILQKQLAEIFLKCVVKLKITKDSKYGEEWYFMEQVWNANLVAEPKQYFLLGQLAQKVHDVGPEALEKTMQAMGKWKVDPEEEGTGAW